MSEETFSLVKLIDRPSLRSSGILGFDSSITSITFDQRSVQSPSTAG